MHHHELECHAKRLVCYFQGQGHSKGSYDKNMTVSTISSELLILLLTLIVHYHKLECLMKKLNWCIQGEGHSKISKCQRMLIVCPDGIFWIVEPFTTNLLRPNFGWLGSKHQLTTKLSMVMHHHEPDCVLETLGHCLQGQGHSERSYNQNITFLICLLNCCSFCSLAWFWWLIISSWIILWKDWGGILLRNAANLVFLV